MGILPLTTFFAPKWRLARIAEPYEATDSVVAVRSVPIIRFGSRVRYLINRQASGADALLKQGEAFDLSETWYRRQAGNAFTVQLPRDARKRTLAGSAYSAHEVRALSL